MYAMCILHMLLLNLEANCNDISTFFYHFLLLDVTIVLWFQSSLASFFNDCYSLFFEHL